MTILNRLRGLGFLSASKYYIDVIIYNDFYSHAQKIEPECMNFTHNPKKFLKKQQSQWLPVGPFQHAPTGSIFEIMFIRSFSPPETFIANSFIKFHISFKDGLHLMFSPPIHSLLKSYNLKGKSCQQHQIHQIYQIHQT